MSGLQKSQADHACAVMRHFNKIDLDELREEADDEEAATRAFRKAEDLYMDVDEAMYAIREVSE